MQANKKSQGFSIGLIVAAVIGLILIVIVVAVLTGKLSDFSKESKADKLDCGSACRAAGLTTGVIDASGTPGIKDGAGAQCKCS